MFERNEQKSIQQLMLEYNEYLEEKKILAGRKMICRYKDINLGLTPKQVELLKLVAKGFSNPKIAQKLKAKESTIKLSIYRLMKYLERRIYEHLDRFYLIIIAQQVIFKE